MKQIVVRLNSSLEVEDGNLQPSLGQWKDAFEHVEATARCLVRSRLNTLDCEVTHALRRTFPWLKSVRIRVEIDPAKE